MKNDKPVPGGKEFLTAEARVVRKNQKPRRGERISFAPFGACNLASKRSWGSRPRLLDFRPLGAWVFFLTTAETTEEFDFLCVSAMSFFSVSSVALWFNLRDDNGETTRASPHHGRNYSVCFIRCGRGQSTPAEPRSSCGSSGR